jgi:hypothetical protein
MPEWNLIPSVMIGMVCGGGDRWQMRGDAVVMASEKYRDRAEGTIWGSVQLHVSGRIGCSESLKEASAGAGSAVGASTTFQMAGRRWRASKTEIEVDKGLWWEKRLGEKYEGEKEGENGREEY